MAYIPYGYKIQDGVVTVDEKAAGQVKVFFEKYISGLSLTVAG
ncbi:TPA: recombinase, partial [Streptococcus suis]